MRGRTIVLLACVTASLAGICAGAIREASKGAPPVPVADVPPDAIVAVALRRVPQPVSAPKPLVQFPAVADAARSRPLADVLVEGSVAERLRAIESAVAAEDTSALDALGGIDLTEDAYLAAATIRAVAALGAISPPDGRDRAAEMLGRWLDQERKRIEFESQGNVSILAEALGLSRSPAAIAPLVRALDDRDVPIYVDTLIVASLSELGDRRGLSAVRAFAGRVKSSRASAGLEADLRDEAIAAVEAALAKMTQA